MNSLEVNLNGYVQTPNDYHLHINGKYVMLVRNEPLFKEGDIIETNTIYGNYIAVVENISNDGCVCYKILLDMNNKQIYLNSKHSIVQDHWIKVLENSYKRKMMEILYENCWNK